MTIFEKALKYILENEGTYSNNKNDNGGATNFGISEKFLKSIGISKNVKTLKLEEATKIYEKYFWISNSFHKIKNENIAIKLFDMSINFGGKTAIKMLQQNIGVFQDGIIGQKTLSAIESFSEAEILEGLIKTCEKRYQKIIERNPSQKIFEKGWMKRAKRIPN